MLDENTGFQTMLIISKILNSEVASSECFPDSFGTEELAHLKFGLITLVYVKFF